MATVKSVRSQERLSDDLTSQQQNRLRAAVVLLVNHLLDNASLNRKNEITTNVESLKATKLQAEQLSLEL